MWRLMMCPLRGSRLICVLIQVYRHVIRMRFDLRITYAVEKVSADRPTAIVGFSTQSQQGTGC